MSILNKVQVCPDGHTCENGSLCIPLPLMEGKYSCDCDDAAGSTVYSGLYCQHEATVFCTDTGDVSRTSFCTNEGTCLGKVDASSTMHPGCDCPEGYVGEHCQFVEGSKPENYNVLMPPSATANDSMYSNTGGMGAAGIVIGVVVAAVFLVMAVGWWMMRRRRQYAETHVVERSKSTDGNLHNSDGESMHGQSLHLQPTAESKTFESENDPNGTSNKTDVEDAASESGHMA